MAQELQHEEWSEPRLRGTLEPALRELGRPATLGDIVAATGLPAERVEPVLRALLDQYDGRLAVDERGELIYGFPRGLDRKRTLSELAAQALAALWLWFKLAYKVGISVMLVTYFTVFLIIAVVVLVVAIAGIFKDADLDGCGDGCDLGGCGDGCANVFFWMPTPPITVQTESAKPRRGRRGKARDENWMPFWQRVYEFVFGPDEPKYDALAVERELLEFVRDQRGRVTAAELAALRGLSLEEADKLALHLMVEHGGDVTVSDTGTLIYVFDNLMTSAEDPAASAQEATRWRWWWERSEPRRTLNRNTAGTNWGIGFLNGFNLLASLLLGGALWEEGLGWFLGLGLVPLTFSALLFLIPLVRWLKLPAQNAAVERRNRWRTWAARVFAGSAGDIDESERDFEAFARWWQAEPEVDDDGRVRYRFERIDQELTDVAAAREAVDPAQFRLGAIDYDSDKD